MHFFLTIIGLVWKSVRRLYHLLIWDQLLWRVWCPIILTKNWLTFFSTCCTGITQCKPLFFKACDVDNEAVITFEEWTTATQQKSTQDSRVTEKWRQLKCRYMGYHHWQFNVWPVLWKCQKLNLMELNHLYQVRLLSEDITALHLCKSADVGHFDKEGGNLLRMCCNGGCWEHCVD